MVVFAILPRLRSVARSSFSALRFFLFCLEAALLLLVLVDEVAGRGDFEAAEDNHGDYCGVRLAGET
jgi:hypothetical protein